MEALPYTFKILAPEDAQALTSSRCVRDDKLYARLLTGLQTLRGRTYLEDGAIKESQVDRLGRHLHEDDHRSWHFLLTDLTEEVLGCARYLLHTSEAGFDDLRLSTSPLAQDPVWGARLRRAVEDALTNARRDNIHIVELGGWALDRRYRHSRAALEILLGSYAWGALIGHCLGTCTATWRNESASILRRIGGASLHVDGHPIPPYWDEDYGCKMEILSFDSRQSPQRFRGLIENMQIQIAQATIICPECRSRDLHRLHNALAFHQFEIPAGSESSISMLGRSSPDSEQRIAQDLAFTRNQALSP